MKLKIKNKKIRILFWASIAILTAVGSLPNFEEGPWPFYIEKTGETKGISFCFVTKYPPGTSHKGINISFVTIQNEDTKIVGGNLSLVNVDKHSGQILGEYLSPEDTGRAVMNGVEFGIFNFNMNNDDYKEILLTSSIKEMNGIQIGVIGSGSDLKGVQIGFLNVNHESYFRKKMGVLINIDDKHSIRSR